MLPKISVVTPSYNAGAFLERTILSIVSQKYTNFEYSIVDGKSTDSTLDVISMYRNRLAFCIQQPDKGQSDAINKGFAKSRGEWLCWVNGDDVLFPGALDKIAKCAIDNPDAEVITGNVVYIDAEDRVTQCVRVPRQSWSFYSRGVGFFAAPAIFFKKALFDKVGGLDVNLHYSMDVELFHKFRKAGAKVCHIDSYLGGFRRHGASKTGTFRGMDQSAFENPETTAIREKYIPQVSVRTIWCYRYLYRCLRVLNFNLVLGYYNGLRYKNKKWQAIFK